MSNKQLTQPEHTSFESLKHESEGNEFWYARELQTVLDYSTWDKFERVIKKAITACEGSGQSSEDHFSQVGKMVDIGSGLSELPVIISFPVTPVTSLCKTVMPASR